MEPLAIFTLIILTTFVVLLVALGVMIGLAGWRLDRRNRVDPHHSSPAPLTWLVSPVEPATLHRKLRDAAAVTHQLGPIDEHPPLGTVDDLRQKILQQAALLDRDVVAASRTPRRHRREMMKTIRPQVREVENLTRRVTDLSRRTHGPSLPAGVEPPEVALREIAERVAMLERAEAEVAEIERANGLLDAERVLRDGQAATPPPAPQSLPQGTPPVEHVAPPPSREPIRRTPRST